MRLRLQFERRISQSGVDARRQGKRHIAPLGKSASIQALGNFLRRREVGHLLQEKTMVGAQLMFLFRGDPVPRGVGLQPRFTRIPCPLPRSERGIGLVTQVVRGRGDHGRERVRLVEQAPSVTEGIERALLSARAQPDQAQRKRPAAKPRLFFGLGGLPT